jgi:hypothetical protein
LIFEGNPSGCADCEWLRASSANADRISANDIIDAAKSAHFNEQNLKIILAALPTLEDEKPMISEAGVAPWIKHLQLYVGRSH